MLFIYVANLSPLYLWCWEQPWINMNKWVIYYHGNVTGWWFQLSTPLKHFSQLGSLFPTYGKKKCSKPPTRLDFQRVCYGPASFCKLTVHRFSRSFATEIRPNGGSSMRARRFWGPPKLLQTGHVRQKWQKIQKWQKSALRVSLPKMIKHLLPPKK